MRDFRTRYSERSRLVHNVWGTSPDHPDKAIWCAAKDATSHSVKLASIKDDAELDMFLDQGNVEIWSHCSTYTVKDRQDVYDRLVHYTEQVRSFTVELQLQNPVIAERFAAERSSAAQDNLPPPATPQDQIQE